MTIRRGKGYRPDPTDHRRTDVRVMMARRGLSLAAELPPQASLVEAGPKVFDQGDSGSCGPNTMARLIATRLAIANAPLPWVPSQDDIYKVARALARGGAHVPLEDIGTEPNQLVRGVGEFGVRPMGPTPPDGRYSDVDPATMNDEPTLANLEIDASTLVLGDYAITSTGAQRELELRSALAHGFPIGCAVDASDNSPIQNYVRGLVIGDMGTTLDHYVSLLAYRTADDGGDEFGFVNSWGASWGDDGMFWMRGTAIQQLGDIIALDAMKVRAA